MLLLPFNGGQEKEKEASLVLQYVNIWDKQGRLTFFMQIIQITTKILIDSGKQSEFYFSQVKVIHFHKQIGPLFRPLVAGFSIGLKPSYKGKKN